MAPDPADLQVAVPTPLGTPPAGPIASTAKHAGARLRVSASPPPIFRWLLFYEKSRGKTV